MLKELIEKDNVGDKKLVAVKKIIKRKQPKKRERGKLWEENEISEKNTRKRKRTKNLEIESSDKNMEFFRVVEQVPSSPIMPYIKGFIMRKKII